MSEPLHVVLGGAGGLGAAVVRRLADRGHRVRSVVRNTPPSAPAGVEVIAADITTPEGIERACADAGVVYQAAQPPYDRWPEQFPAMTATVLGGVGRAGAKLVQVDNLYMYGPHPAPIDETTPRRATGAKGTTRIRMEEQLLDAHAQGRARVTVGRLSDYYGPDGLNSTVAALVLEPAAKGTAMRWLGGLDIPHTLHYLDDAAAGLVVLGEDEAADGQIWHLPAAPPVTGRRFGELVNDALPRPVAVKTMGLTMLRIGGLFSKEAKEVVETWYQWAEPFVTDSSRFDAAFGPLATTPHEEAVPATVAWLLEQTSR